MSRAVRVAGWLWGLAGVALVILGIWTLVQTGDLSGVTTGTFGALAIFCGLMLAVTGVPSYFWSLLVTVPALLYALGYAFAGGFEEAPSDAPAVLVLALVSIYTLTVILWAKSRAP
jgi:hypothetical protein